MTSNMDYGGQPDVVATCVACKLGIHEDEPYILMEPQINLAAIPYAQESFLCRSCANLIMLWPKVWRTIGDKNAA